MTVESIIFVHNCENSYLPAFFKEFIQILVNTHSERHWRLNESIWKGSTCVLQVT